MARPAYAYLAGINVLLNLLLFSSYIQSNSFTFYFLIAVNVLVAVASFATYKQAHLANFEITFRKALPILIQGTVQLSIFYYVSVWGLINNLRPIAVPSIFLWRMPFVFYQILFAFVFDYLFTIARGKSYRPQFYVIPLVLSINLFMWFLHDFTILHLVVIIIGIMIKTYVVRREPDGRTTHVFNPSFIILALASLTIIALGLPNATPNLRTGELAGAYDETPYFNIFVLCVGCLTLWIPNSYLIALGAYATVMLINYLSLFFYGEQIFDGLVRGSIFIAIMLGITDPQTSPKTYGGKFLFGAAYGLCLILCYFLLPILWVDTYFSKILPIPVLNLFVRQFDAGFTKLTSETYGYLTYYRTRLVAIAVFVLIFTVTYQQLIYGIQATYRATDVSLTCHLAKEVRAAFGLRSPCNPTSIQ